MMDGVQCGSMEGFLQALKFECVANQHEVCALVGKAAKVKGRTRNAEWKERQRLWWAGDGFSRGADKYQTLLDRAFAAMFEQCPEFRAALVATGCATLQHSMGKSSGIATVLTEFEFCTRLTELREKAKLRRDESEICAHLIRQAKVAAIVQVSQERDVEFTQFHRDMSAMTVKVSKGVVSQPYARSDNPIDMVTVERNPRILDGLYANSQVKA